MCFWAVWRLALRVLTPRQALVSVLMLETIWYYPFLGAKFDQGSLLISLWMLLALAFHSALTTQRLRHWLIVGLFAGLSLLTKYQSVLFRSCGASLMFLTDEGRSSWRRPGPYLALLFLLVMIDPNLYWLQRNDFISWQYALGRLGESEYHWHDHLTQPLRFTADSLGSLLPFLVLIGLLYSSSRPAPEAAVQFHRRFSAILGLSPFLLTLGLSALFGIHLYSKWEAPYFPCWKCWPCSGFDPISVQSESGDSPCYAWDSEPFSLCLAPCI